MRSDWGCSGAEILGGLRDQRPWQSGANLHYVGVIEKRLSNVDPFMVNRSTLSRHCLKSINVVPGCPRVKLCDEILLAVGFACRCIAGAIAC